MAKQVISFDVGIKNMAYCLFDISGTNVSIADWKVLSMMDEELPMVYCNCSSVKEKKQSVVANFFTATSAPVKLCGRVAKFKNGEQYYCDKHAKSQTSYRIPEKKNIKKMHMTELTDYATVLGLLGLPKKKSDIIALVDAFLREHSLEHIVAKKGVKAGDTDLVVIGKNMKRIFNDVLKDTDIDYVLIENQISTLATRMKTVQGMLAQYFIMSCEDVAIEFVSSANKLKMFSKETMEEVKEETQSQKYKTHKKDGVFYCEQILKSGQWSTELWTKCEKKKKDDLADCFLQGVWWLKRENLI